MELKGLISDRCELNRQIKADNTLLRELKALVAKLTKVVQTTVSAIAHAMEKIRQNMVVLTYGLFHNRRGRNKDATGKYSEQYDEADAILNSKMATAKAEFFKLKEQSADLDFNELTDARLAIRQRMEEKAFDRISRNIKGEKVSIRDYWNSIKYTDELLGEAGMAERRQEQKRRSSRFDSKTQKTHERE